MPSNKRIFTLRLTDEDYSKIKLISESDNRSMANYIENLVKLNIEAFEAENGVILLESEE